MCRSILSFPALFISLVSMGQYQKLPPKGSKYLLNRECSYPRQVGKLEYIKNTTLSQVEYRTDSLKMIVRDSIGGAWLRPDNKASARTSEFYIPLDSITGLLFSNGLLTPDLLVNVFNKDLEYIDDKGITTVLKKHTGARSMKLNAISQVDYGKKLKLGKNEMILNVSVVFEDDPMAIYVFHLRLRGKTRPSPYTLAKYLQTASIVCFRYQGLEI